MTSASATRSVSPIDDHQNLRLRLKPRAPVTGFVDGGWWPRSRDLPAELPTLLAVLAVRLGRVESVSYNLDAWGPAPRRITLGGRLVRLAGYRSQHPDTIDVLSAGHRVTLLVVPPETAPEAAHGTLMAAGHRGNADHIDALLLADRADPADPADGDAADADEVAQQRWDLDGGPVHMAVGGSRLVHAPDA
jgi:uncharacterized protein DUF5994